MRSSRSRSVGRDVGRLVGQHPLVLAERAARASAAASAPSTSPARRSWPTSFDSSLTSAPEVVALAAISSRDRSSSAGACVELIEQRRVVAAGQRGAHRVGSVRSGGRRSQSQEHTVGPRPDARTALRPIDRAVARLRSVRVRWRAPGSVLAVTDRSRSSGLDDPLRRPRRRRRASRSPPRPARSPPCSARTAPARRRTIEACEGYRRPTGGRGPGARPRPGRASSASSARGSA